MIPLLSGGLIYLEKGRIFSRVRNGFGIGLTLLLAALAIHCFGNRYSSVLSPNDLLALVALSMVAVWVGLFALCYGKETCRAAAFQLSLILLIVPLPEAFLERVIPFMQGCSALAVALLFRLSGFPVFQDGFRFSLPGADVEVAKQCSGIRSALALFITSLLMGYIFLRSPWRRLWLVLAVFPVTILKNALRIVTIYWLTVHASLGPVTVWVHRYGGIPFSYLGLSLLALFVITLRRFEWVALQRARG